MTTPARRGRRPAGEDTRAAILRAARAEFAEHGFDAASVRAIARRAGVDPALVRHYFRSKADLLAASLVPRALDPASVVAALARGPRETMGERLARTVLGVWDTPEGRATFRTVLSGAMSADPGAGVFFDYVRTTVFAGLASALDIPDSERRVALVASHMIGVLVTRFVLELEPVASMMADELVAAIAPALQRYLFEPLPVLGPGPRRPLASGAGADDNSSHEE